MKFFFPEEMRRSPEMVEMHDELSLVSIGGFKSKHDDFCDTISMLSSMDAWKPSHTADLSKSEGGGIWELEEEEVTSQMDSYIV